MKPNILNKINSLEVGSFISKLDLGLDPLSIDVRISQIRKQLFPKEFKSVSKHLVRTK